MCQSPYFAPCLPPLPLSPRLTGLLQSLTHFRILSSSEPVHLQSLLAKPSSPRNSQLFPGLHHPGLQSTQCFNVTSLRGLPQSPTLKPSPPWPWYPTPPLSPPQFLLFLFAGMFMAHIYPPECELHESRDLALHVPCSIPRAQDRARHNKCLLNESLLSLLQATPGFPT